MVDKARSNPFSVFIRKIGYSVGLESTLERLNDFACAYAADSTFTYGDLKQLLHNDAPNGWGLKNEHIFDVLKSLDILFVRTADVTILDTGESLGILRSLQGDVAFNRSLRFLFLESLIRADGDVFLNALISSFDPATFTNHISMMLQNKWTILEKNFLTSTKRSAIYQAVSIETQENNPGSKGSSLFNASKKSPFETTIGINSLKVERPSVSISGSYLKKALPRRKAWAVSLGLSEESGKLTELGHFFIQSLSKKGFGGPNCMCVWPLRYELSSPEFVSTKIGDEIGAYTTWDYLKIIAEAYRFYDAPFSEDINKAINILLSVYQTYQSLNTSKSIVRSELPGRVALRAGMCLASETGNVPDFMQAIAEEQKQKEVKSRLVYRNSKIAEFALS